VTALADDKNAAGKNKLVRWDLVQVKDGVIIAGSDVGKDAATSDTITMTGTGQAEPPEGEAAGGGTFVHRNSSGATLAQGVYVVTGFNSWDNRGGSLAGFPVKDGLGEKNEVSGGILAINVRLFPEGGVSHDGLMTVNCKLPGSTGAITEGITLDISGTPFHFKQSKGETLLHVLEGGSSE